MKIAIFGVGFVGGALKRWLEAYTDHTLVFYDPQKGFASYDASGIAVNFICVPVPTIENGDLELSNLIGCLKLIRGHAMPKNQPVFIRSTILPGTNKFLQEWFPELSIYPMPEFLNERNAFKDMERNDIIVGDNGKNHDLLTSIFPGKKLLHMQPDEATMAKYAHNCLGASKVNLCNVIHDQCQQLKIRYEKVRQGFLMTGHVDPLMTLVPGPDGKMGYGGSCYTKDMEAFAAFTNAESIKATVKENEQFRGGKDE